LTLNSVLSGRGRHTVLWTNIMMSQMRKSLIDVGVFHYLRMDGCSIYRLIPIHSQSYFPSFHGIA